MDSLKISSQNSLKVSSPDFENEGWMQKKNTGYGEDKSPELHIDGLSDNVKSLIITFDDLDHPIRPGFNHWIAWNVTPVSVIPENIFKGTIIDEPIHMEQGLGYGKHCYRGPKPPFNWNHKYVFTVYALDCLLELSGDSNKEKVMIAAKEHILAKGELFGRYQRKHK